MPAKTRTAPVVEPAAVVEPTSSRIPPVLVDEMPAPVVEPRVWTRIRGRETQRVLVEVDDLGIVRVTLDVLEALLTEAGFDRQITTG